MKNNKHTYIAVINLVLLIILAVVLALVVRARLLQAAQDNAGSEKVTASLQSSMNVYAADCIDAHSKQFVKKLAAEHEVDPTPPPHTPEPTPEATPEATPEPTPEPEPTPDPCYLSMSDSEFREFATLVYLEAGCESYECKKAVASVIVNRMTTRGMSVRSVIYEVNQFSPAASIPYNSPDSASIQAVSEVLQYGPTIPQYVTFFRANYYFDWVIPYMSIDHTYFSYDPSVKASLGM